MEISIRREKQRNDIRKKAIQQIFDQRRKLFSNNTIASIFHSMKNIWQSSQNLQLPQMLERLRQLTYQSSLEQLSDFLNANNFFQFLIKLAATFPHKSNTISLIVYNCSFATKQASKGMLQIIPFLIYQVDQDGFNLLIRLLHRIKIQKMIENNMIDELEEIFNIVSDSSAKNLFKQQENVFWIIEDVYNANGRLKIQTFNNLFSPMKEHINESKQINLKIVNQYLRFLVQEQQIIKLKLLMEMIITLIDKNFTIMQKTFETIQQIMEKRIWQSKIFVPILEQLQNKLEQNYLNNDNWKTTEQFNQVIDRLLLKIQVYLFIK